MVPFVLGDDAWKKFPNLKRHFDAIGARPAAHKANTLKDRHAFKAERTKKPAASCSGTLRRRRREGGP